MNNIKEINRKLVKPCIPTPPNLKNYKLSFIDEFLPQMEVGVLLFYTSNVKPIDLEESLAKVLIQFYPLAGRLIFKDQTVDCSDQGAEFVEAEAPDIALATLIVERDFENLRGLLPRRNGQVDDASDPILSIQVTQLKCSGLVIGISISHKILDASSLGTFVAAWSNASNPGTGVKMSVKPYLDSSSLFPGKNQNKYSDAIVRSAMTPRVVVKMFKFHKEAIASLRSNLRPKEGKQGISRVLAVSALITKAVIGLNMAKTGRSKDCLIYVPVNMRERTIPPLHKHACGNLMLQSVSRCMAAAHEGEEEIIGIQELVDLIDDAIAKSVSDCTEILSLCEDERNDMLINPLKTASIVIRSGEANGVCFSDWSKFGFYEADFGWGKPVWAGIAPLPSGNTAVLMENREGDGIEAWVHLDKNDMPLFEQDKGIRLFAT